MRTQPDHHPQNDAFFVGEGHQPLLPRHHVQCLTLDARCSMADGPKEASFVLPDLNPRTRSPPGGGGRPAVTIPRRSIISPKQLSPPPLLQNPSVPVSPAEKPVPEAEDEGKWDHLVVVVVVVAAAVMKLVRS